MTTRPATKKRFPAVLALLLVLAASRAVAVDEVAGPAATLDRAGDLARFALDSLGELPPLAFFGAMAVLCVLPVPVSVFYLAGAAIYGPGTTLVWVAGALALNIWLGQTLASRALRPIATRILERRGIRVPQVGSGSDELLLIVLVRIAPGVPFFAQNLALGLANVDRTRSLAVSLPIQMAFASGFILLGRSAFEGSLGTAVVAIGLIVSVSIAARLFHRRLAARRPRPVLGG